MTKLLKNLKTQKYLPVIYEKNKFNEQAVFFNELGDFFNEWENGG